MLLLSLGTRAVVSLRLLAMRWSLLLSLRLLLRLRRILTGWLGWLRMVSVRGCCVRAVLRIIVAHIAILLGTLAVRRRRLRRQRG
jgi:hypothetical protein